MWGSLKANPKITCEVYDHTYDSRRAIDRAIFPPGSTASLRWDVPSNTGEAGDQWRISIDNYADQFGAGSEFWVQWRTRMNPTYATHHFKAHDGGVDAWNGTYTGFKHCFFGGGMQFPYSVEGSPATHYGYQGTGTQSNNVMNTTRTDSDGEIVMRNRDVLGSPVHAKYPVMYISKGFEGMESRGRNINYLTHANEGVEGAHAAACEFTPDPDVYSDVNTCFLYPSNQWFTLMIHVIVGNFAQNVQSSLGPTRTGYANSTIEYYGQITPGTPMRLLHRRTGVVLPTDFGGDVGAQGREKYGMFGWTTFMTAKWPSEAHPLAQIWVSQIIIQSGSTAPAAPSV